MTVESEYHRNTGGPNTTPDTAAVDRGNQLRNIYPPHSEVPAIAQVEQIG